MLSSVIDFKTQCSSQRRCYLGAVALNNSAVTLLERGHYLPALVVLDDAVVAIREVLLFKNDDVRTLHEGSEDTNASPAACSSLKAWMESSSFPPTGTLDLKAMLDRASRCVMDSCPEGVRVPIQSQVIDVEMPQLDTETGAYPPSMAGATLIRLDAPDCCCAGGGRTHADDIDDHRAASLPHLELITILHNYAVAARLLPLSEQALRRGAVYVTHLAFCHVCRLFCPPPAAAPPPPSRYDNDDATATSRSRFEDVALLQLSLLLTTCNYQLYAELGDSWGSTRSLAQHQLVLQALDADEVVFARRLLDLSIPHAKAA